MKGWERDREVDRETERETDRQADRDDIMLEKRSGCQFVQMKP